MNCSVDETQSPFPASVLAQWNREWNGSNNRTGAVYGITNLLLSVQVASRSDQSWVGDIPHAPRGSANYLKASRFHWPSLIFEGVICPLSSLKYVYSRFRFAFTACCASVSTTTWGLTECFIHCHCVWHHIAPDQETHSVVKEVMQWAIAHRIHWSNCISYYQEAPGLIEDLVMVPLGNRKDVVHALN